MNRTEDQLIPGFRRSQVSTINGERTRHVVTFDRTKASPEEYLYINTPKLKPDCCLVPGSFHLLFDFKVSNTKTSFLNNLSKLLQNNLHIKVGRETVYENNKESFYSLYKDLYKTNSERNNMIEYGIASQNLRKLISKDDSGATSGDATKVSEKLMFDIFGTKQKICLDKIIRDHALYAPFQMINNFLYIIKFPKSSEILVAQNRQTLEEYTLENLQLEYETIENKTIADEVPSLYSIGRSLSFEHITLFKMEPWAASSTVINELINVPRKSMKAIVMLFIKNNRTDSEEFIYPNITEVKLQIEGVPGQVYSQGIKKSRFYEEAMRLFGSKDERDEFMTPQKFYKDKFAWVIDLRSNEEVNKTRHGERLQNTQNGIMMEINKTSHTDDISCYYFIVSDAAVKFQNYNMKAIVY